MLRRKIKEVVPGIYWLENLRVAFCYFVLSEKGELYLIDTATALEKYYVRHCLKRFQRPLKAILLTHCHLDHAGSAEAFSRETDCEVYCSEKEQPYLNGEKELKRRNYDGVPPFGRFIQFGDTILRDPKCEGTKAFEEETPEEFEFIPIAGHTPGSGVILHKPTRSLFFGDCLLNCEAITMKAKVGLTLPYECFAEDWQASIENLKALEEVDFDHAFFGHGPPIVGDAKARVISFLKEKDVL